MYVNAHCARAENRRDCNWFSFVGNRFVAPLTQVSGDQGMLQHQIHRWLGGLQERRNATGYVHFCAPVERRVVRWR